MSSVESMRLPINLTEAFRDLVQIGIALTSERDLASLLDLILSEARRFTRAEAGTLLLREDNTLGFAVLQNDRLVRELGETEMQRRLQAEPLKLSEMSLAAYVALTGDVANIADTAAIPPTTPPTLNPPFDARCEYGARAALVVPMQDPTGNVLGVLELLNPLDEAGEIVAFDAEYEALVRSLSSQAAGAIRHARPAAPPFQDAPDRAH